MFPLETRLLGVHVHVKYGHNFVGCNSCGDVLCQGSGAICSFCYFSFRKQFSFLKTIFFILTVTVIINYNIPEGNLTGEILIFSDQYICHRCIKDEGEWLTFKGDNSEVLERATRDELRAIFIKVSENQLIEILTPEVMHACLFQ